MNKRLTTKIKNLCFMLLMAIVVSPILADENPFKERMVLQCDSETDAKQKDLCVKEKRRREYTKVLYLRGSSTNNKTLSEINKYPNLTSLVLSGSRVNDSGIQTLVKHPKIYFLSLEGTPISNRAMQGLSRMPSLGMLDISKTRVSDNGIMALNKSYLSYLNISWTSVTDEGIKALVTEFPNLYRLDLMNLDVTDDNIKGFLNVKNEDLFKKTLDETMSSGLIGMFSSNTERLDFDNNGFKKLQDLNLSGTKITNRSIVILSAIKSLKLLNVSYTLIDDDGMSHIGRNQDLEVLSLSGTQVTDSSMDELKNLSSLKVLSLENTLITDSGLDDLKDVPDLVSVYLKGSKVTVEGMTKLQEEMPDLRIHHPNYKKPQDQK